jgi:hypothetical protein
LVKWLGYIVEHNTWKPEKHLTRCADIIMSGLMLVSLRTVYMRNKRSSCQNKNRLNEREKLRNAPYSKMQVNLKERCLVDVDLMFTESTVLAL